MDAVAQMFALARQHHLAGSLSQAEQLLRQVLQADPAHAEAHYLLGSVNHQTGRNELAIALLTQALQLKPNFPEAHFGIGAALADSGKLQEAVAHYRQALQLNPNFLEAHNNLGTALLSQGKVEEAVGHLQAAQRLCPGSAEANINLASALEQLGRSEEAAALSQEALRLRPDSAEAYNNLGNALVGLDQIDRAVACYREALKLNPHFALTYNNLGNALVRQDKTEEAIACYLQAAQCNADYAEAHANLGNVRLHQGQYADAQACYDRAFRLDATHPETHFNQAILWLMHGNFAQGWPSYEYRWQTKGFPRYRFSQPHWDGSPLAGRTLLLLAEQGLGDTLQFIRYAPLLQQQGARVILQCQPPLGRLLANVPGVAQVVRQGTPLPTFDTYSPLLSLPAILGTSLDNIPAKVPYLEANADLVEHWRRELDPLKGFRIGIAWQGAPPFRPDRQRRSIPLTFFSRLAKVPGVRLISLQKGPGTEQLQALDGQFEVFDLGNRLDDVSGPFMDTAAIMKNIDLVISSDTAVPHLAGALAVPVWVPLPLVPDWRWLLEREDSPWYPTMRLFRQGRYGDWEEPFERVVEELKTLIAQRER